MTRNTLRTQEYRGGPEGIERSPSGLVVWVAWALTMAVGLAVGWLWRGH